MYTDTARNGKKQHDVRAGSTQWPTSHELPAQGSRASRHRARTHRPRRDIREGSSALSFPTKRRRTQGDCGSIAAAMPQSRRFLPASPLPYSECARRVARSPGHGVSGTLGTIRAARQQSARRRSTIPDRAAAPGTQAPCLRQSRLSRAGVALPTGRIGRETAVRQTDASGSQFAGNEAGQELPASRRASSTAPDNAAACATATARRTESSSNGGSFEQQVT